MPRKPRVKRQDQITALRARKRAEDGVVTGESKITGKGKLLSPKTVRELELDWQIFEMRRDGHTVQEIATYLGIALSTVRDHIIKVLNRTISETAETAEENRQLQIDRLDSILKQYMPMATGGSLAAASMVLSVEARRAKLLALDVPEVKRVDVTGIREYVGVDVEKV